MGQEKKTKLQGILCGNFNGLFKKSDVGEGARVRALVEPGQTCITRLAWVPLRIRIPLWDIHFLVLLNHAALTSIF